MSETKTASKPITTAQKVARKIFLSEINEKGSELELSPAIDWVADAVARVDEADGDELDGPAPSPSASAAKALTPAARAPRAIEGLLSLRKVDEVVVISGRIKTTLQLTCSRCANGFHFKATPQFSTLFCKDPVMAGVAYTDKTGKPVGQNQGYARHAHASDAQGIEDAAGDQSESSDSSLDITYLTEDFIDLSEVVTEQLRLEVPFQPLCKEDCKGICPTCGTDFNLGRCACAKLSKPSPFAALQNLKL